MPKASSSPKSISKTATKKANDKTSQEPKEKRPPNRYQLYVAHWVPIFCAEHPDRKKEAMAWVAEQWKSAPENPRRGQEPKSKKKKVPKARADEPSSSSQPAITDDEDKENDAPSSDF